MDVAKKKAYDNSNNLSSIWTVSDTIFINDSVENTIKELINKKENKEELNLLDSQNLSTQNLTAIIADIYYKLQDYDNRILDNTTRLDSYQPPVKWITQEEYDNKSQQGELDPKTAYFISDDADGDEGGYAIVKMDQKNPTGYGYFDMNTKADFVPGSYAMNFGNDCEAIGNNATTEGYKNIAKGACSHVEGCYTTSEGDYSHTEGYQTHTFGKYSHAEGLGTSNSTNKETIKTNNKLTCSTRFDRAYIDSHQGQLNSCTVKNTSTTTIELSQGQKITIQFRYSAGGQGGSSTVYYERETTINKNISILPNSSQTINFDSVYLLKGDIYNQTFADISNISIEYKIISYCSGSFGIASHTEGNKTYASGDYSHAEGNQTIAIGENQHVQGKYNIEDTGKKYAHIIGNGTDESNRSNALTVDWNGNLEALGTICGKNGLKLNDWTIKLDISTPLVGGVDSSGANIDESIKLQRMNLILTNDNLNYGDGRIASATITINLLDKSKFDWDWK